MSFEVTDVVLAERASAGLDAGEGDIYRGGDSAEGQGGLPGYVDWVGDVKGYQGLRGSPRLEADARHRSFAAQNAVRMTRG